MVEAEERGDRAHPFLDVAADHDPAFAGDVAREQQVHVVEVPGEEGSPRDPADGNAARAVIGRVDVVFALRIVELRRAPLDDHVAVGLLPEIDARLADVGAAGRDRRNILQIEQRQPFGALAGDRGHHHAVAVGEEHVAVDPGLRVRRQQRGFQLAGREHHALIRAVEPVAVDVHVMELVVGADLLQLRVGIHQRLPVPQPDVVDGRLVGLERLEGEVLFGGEGLRRDLTEIVSLLGQRDVALDVGLLQLQLVRFDEHALEYPGTTPDSTNEPPKTSTAAAAGSR